MPLLTPSILGAGVLSSSRPCMISPAQGPWASSLKPSHIQFLESCPGNPLPPSMPPSQSPADTTLALSLFPGAPGLGDCLCSPQTPEPQAPQRPFLPAGYEAALYLAPNLPLTCPALYDFQAQGGDPRWPQPPHVWGPLCSAPQQKSASPACRLHPQRSFVENRGLLRTRGCTPAAFLPV